MHPFDKTRRERENVRNTLLSMAWVLAECQLKFKPRSKYDFFHRNLRRAREKWRERAFLFYFIF